MPNLEICKLDSNLESLEMRSSLYASRPAVLKLMRWQMTRIELQMGRKLSIENQEWLKGWLSVGWSFLYLLLKGKSKDS